MTIPNIWENQKMFQTINQVPIGDQIQNLATHRMICPEISAQLLFMAEFGDPCEGKRKGGDMKYSQTRVTIKHIIKHRRTNQGLPSLLETI